MARGPRLSNVESQVAQATWVFVKDRMMDREVLEWALDLTQQQTAERDAIRQTFDRQEAAIKSPFREAWQGVFECWSRPESETSYDRLMLKRAAQSSGERAETVRLIISAVRPWVKAESRARYNTVYGEQAPRKPKTVSDVLLMSITSGETLKPEDIGLAQINDVDYLVELVNGINVALLSGLFAAQRIGLINDNVDSTTWQVHRVYFVPHDQYPDGGGEPDRHARGFAPATKLLFAVIERLAAIDTIAAMRVLASWDTAKWSLHKRLWAAAARNEQLIGASTLETFLSDLNAEEFWSPGRYPEYFELRAVRWHELNAGVRSRIERRILRGPSRNLVPRHVEVDEALVIKKRRSIIELRRIQVLGGVLSAKSEQWLADAEQNIVNPPVVGVVTAGFNEGVRLLRGELGPGKRYDNVARAKLLTELEQDINEDAWDDASRAASKFIGREAALILELLVEGLRAEHSFPKIWNAYGHAFRPTRSDSVDGEVDEIVPSERAIAAKTCAIIATLPAETIGPAIGGLSNWMSNWSRQLKVLPALFAAWLHILPVAVARANNSEANEKPLEERSMTSAVGDLMNAFRSACPHLTAGTSPLTAWPLKDALDTIGVITGEAKLLAQYSLLMDLPYFYAAQSEWTSSNLIAALKNATGLSIELWKAFTYANYPQREIISELATELLSAATNRALSDETRGNLAARVAWSAISDKRDGLKPLISASSIQQMLRIGGETARIHTLRAIRDYLINDTRPTTVEQRFELVARPLFDSLWPRELTLASRAVSDALANLPSAAGTKFADAVNMILPYVTPFDCWSLWDYGVYDQSDDEKEIRHVVSPREAEAFLALLDRTIGGEEGAVIPSELDKALAHIQVKAPKLESDVRFQRLLTLSRR